MVIERDLGNQSGNQSLGLASVVGRLGGLGQRVDAREQPSALVISPLVHVEPLPFVSAADVGPCRSVAAKRTGSLVDRIAFQ